MVISNDEEVENTEYVIDDLEPAPGEALGELLMHLEDYTPTVPDAVAEQYLHMAGFEAVDPRIVRIISVTAQKFISDIANDALQHCKTRSNSQHSASHVSNKVSQL
ncbi:transcription initiation factor TFIID subunit 10-like [Musca vetustissima]|uniref:transcription initiation factor TFIID subunit 10-like n=1 Tax=Musca vetustissima TaxID=27455 RepID=UPI002AB6FDEA|nr:transcription initiation factor TFIID subunit 10-like [Musca vetustissima]